jgi:hypothetical protein
MLELPTLRPKALLAGATSNRAKKPARPAVFALRLLIFISSPLIAIIKITGTRTPGEMKFRGG